MMEPRPWLFDDVSLFGAQSAGDNDAVRAVVSGLALKIRTSTAVLTSNDIALAFKGTLISLHDIQYLLVYHSS